jgi:hypothetical protein
MTGLEGSTNTDEQMLKAREIYKRVVVPTLQDENREKIVAIDVDSEDFEIGGDLIEICRILRSRRPNATVCGFRLGGGAIDRIGGSSLRWLR